MTRLARGLRGTAAALLAGATVAACETRPDPFDATAPTSISSQSLGGSAPSYTTDAGGAITLTGSGGARPVGAAEVIIGTGQFVRPRSTASSGPELGLTGSDVTLDFANVDVRDVLKSVLGDLLQVSYVIDPSVQGSITLQTGRPIPRASMIDVLTRTLQLNNIALVVRDGVYLAVPIANGPRQAPIGGSVGFVTRVVTPQYVAASDLERVLEPFLPPGTTARADPGRNLLIISGAASDVRNVLNDVATFDVDAMQGMSFALLPLRNGRARDVANDVTGMLTASGRSVADMVRVMAIERMNAVLVVSMQPSYLQRVRGWVERFDRGDGRGDQQLFVYRLQNGRAVDIARTLRRALGIEASGGETDAPTGPGNSASSGGMSASTLMPAPPPGGAASALPAAVSPPSARTDPLANVGAAALLGGGGSGGISAGGPSVRVTADQTNNALIVTATAQDYAPIESAIRKLDITPLQVLIEATVAEVTLDNELRMGLQYFVKSGNFTAAFAPGLNPIDTSFIPRTIGSTFPGFGFLTGTNLAYSSGGTTLVLQALSKLTNVKVLSSPNLLVLNNGTARLQVGNQVPTATGSATSTITPNAPIVNSIDYRDTGVILNVTPRVNASGLVLLDVTEEVSDVIVTDTSRIDSPTISQRRVTSSIAVQDGQTIGLAGLIKENQSVGNSGLPWLKDLPVIGVLFGVRTNRTQRTELLVLITPRVIRNREDGETVTRELREKVRLTIPVANRRGG